MPTIISLCVCVQIQAGPLKQTIGSVQEVHSAHNNINKNGLKANQDSQVLHKETQRLPTL